MRAILGVITLAGFACDYAPALPAGPAPDAAPPDARPGVINGECTGAADGPRVMVYTYENMWRHESNLTSLIALSEMCESRGFNMVFSNDPFAINATRLANLDVVVFSITSGPGMDARNQAELQAWVEAGGGVVGLHSAAATEPLWPWFLQNMGARFRTHAPGMQRATVRIESGTHPITAGLAAAFVHTDEWYLFDVPPETVPGITSLLALDEDTLPPSYPDDDKIGYHAIGWAHERYGGRVFYTGLCHNPDCWDEPVIVEVVGRAIEWAAHRR